MPRYKLDQSTKRDNARGREGKEDGERNHNKGGQTTKEAQKQHNPTSPGGQLMQGTTRSPKRQRAAQTILVQSIVRLTKERQGAPMFVHSN